MNQRKHKTFNYQPRFSKEKQTDASLEEGGRERDFVSKWRQNSGKQPRVRGAMSMKILVLILVLLLIAMYLLEKKYL
ncbi:hypothetical protein [Tamlana sp. I1]|uniref:hypothetical protein n=1 Tax=Tamlana sp. I1 TaxID=2762061 RepID=UPI00189001F4|nr:hypothetical protein [Tamlana sp. I1]